MKKRICLCLLPLLALSSCAFEAAVEESPFTPNLTYVEGLPTIQMADTAHTTYLMMSPFGYLDFEGAPVKGEVSDLFYENTIVYQAEPGSPLPSKEQVKSTVNGASFRGWAYYDEENDHVFPDYYTTVPSANGLALKAIFDGTDAGGNSSSSTDERSGYGLLFSDGSYALAAYSGESYGKKEYLASSVTFKAGLSVQMYDFDNNAGWIVDINPYSFGDTTGNNANTASYLTVSGSSWNVVQDFKADVYIQLLYQQDTIYFELK